MMNEEGIELAPACDEIESIGRLRLLLTRGMLEARLKHLLKIMRVDFVLFDGHVSINDVASFREALRPGDH